MIPNNKTIDQLSVSPETFNNYGATLTFSVTFDDLIFNLGFLVN